MNDIRDAAKAVEKDAKSRLAKLITLRNALILLSYIAVAALAAYYL